MTVKTILVCLNDVARIDGLVALAGDIAARHDAHITGLHVTPAMTLYPTMSAQISAEMAEAHRSHYAEQAKRAKAAFETAAKRETAHFEWRETEARTESIVDTFVTNAREADLVVLAQPGDDTDAATSFDFVECVVLESGRPTVIVPSAGTFKSVGRDVVLGWNATREATRAAHDSLQLIGEGGKLRIVWVDPRPGGASSGDLPGSELATSFARHGVNVEVETIATSNIGTGDALLNRVADTGADMLAMGAYGHSRFREMIFGGATRSILQHMTVPVLMSH